MGERRSKRTESAYVSPWVTRALRNDQAGQLAGELRRALEHVRSGGTIIEAVAGTREGWHARIVLSSIVQTALAVWDGDRGRTKGERVALLERALVELGAASERTGGWTVSR